MPQGIGQIIVSHVVRCSVLEQIGSGSNPARAGQKRKKNFFFFVSWKPTTPKAPSNYKNLKIQHRANVSRQSRLETQSSKL